VNKKIWLPAMASSLHAPGCTLTWPGVRNPTASTSGRLTISRFKSSHRCGFHKLEFPDAVLICGRNSSHVTGSLTTALGYLQRSENHKVRCTHDSAEPGEGGWSIPEAQSAVTENLVAAGFDHEDAVWVSENAPSFIQKLREGPEEPDELDKWASANLATAGKEIVSRYRSSGDGVVQLSRQEQWVVVLESVGVRAQNIMRVSYVLSGSSLPEFLKKVNFLREVLENSKVNGEALERKVHQMMMRLSVAADEDLQHTLSFFEKIEAQRGGVALLHSTPFAVACLIENFPKIFLQGLDTKLRPVLDFLESMGVSADAVGQVVLLYPPVLLCDIDQDLKKRARTLTKVGVPARNLGKMVSRYPWILSRSAQNNVKDLVDFLFSIKVPQKEVDLSITRCPQLVGCSTTRTMQPMVDRMNELGVKSKRLGRVIACSPQLLIRTHEEFNEVVGFLSKLGVDPKDMGGMLKRSPEVFASDVSETLETKVQFLEDLGIKDELIQRVVRMFPEMLLMSVKDSLQPRMEYLRMWNISKNNIARMVYKFPPLLGYNVEPVLKPKLQFLVNSMGRQVYEVVEYPRYFSYSLEKRIIPRARVIERRQISCDLKSMLAKNDDEFAAEFLGFGRMLIPTL